MHSNQGINCGYVDFGTELAKFTGGKALKMLLSEQTDDVYAALRDVHFSHVMAELKRRNASLKAISHKRHGLDNLAEMKSFVANDLQVRTCALGVRPPES